MSGWVFADTSSLVAYFVYDEAKNAVASRTVDDILRSRRRLLTTSDVFVELVTWIRAKADYASALQVGEALRTSTYARMIGVDDSLRERAWQLFRKYKMP